MNELEKGSAQVMQLDYLSKDDELTHIHICLDLNQITKLPIAEARKSISVIRLTLSLLMDDVEEVAEMIDDIEDGIETGEVVELYDEAKDEYRYMLTASLKANKLHA